MEWLKDIFLVLAKKCSPKHAFILLFSCILLFSGYYFLDRWLDHKALAVPQYEKREIIKNNTVKKDLTKLQAK